MTIDAALLGPGGRSGPAALTTSLVLAYLKDHGFEAAHAAMAEQIHDDGTPTYLPTAAEPAAGVPPLVAVIEDWMDTRASEAVARLQLDASDLDDDPILNSPPLLTDRILDPPELEATLSRHHGQNILLVQRLTVPDLHVDPVLVTAAADRTLKAVRWADVLATGPDSPTAASVAPSALWEIQLPAPALALAQHPHDPRRAALGCMDGSVVEVDLVAGIVMHKRTPHHPRKPCTVVLYVDSVLVSGAHDRVLVIHHQSKDDPITYTLPGPIETAAPTPDARAVVVGARDTPDLYVCMLDGSGMRPAPLGGDPRETHVSFAPMHMAARGAYLLVATSAASGRVILYRMHGSSTDVVLVRNYYGAVADPYARPRVCWLGDHYFCVTSADHAVFVYAVAPADGVPADGVPADGVPAEHTTDRQIVARLRGHDHVVRDVAYDAPYLCTAGFDHAVRVWRLFP